MPAVLVDAVDPIGRYFKSLSSQKNRDGSVLNSRVHGSREEMFYFLRLSRRGDIPVIRLPAKYGIPDTAAYCVSLISRLLQRIYDVMHFIGQLYLHKKLLTSFSFGPLFIRFPGP